MRPIQIEKVWDGAVASMASPSDPSKQIEVMSMRSSADKTRYRVKARGNMLLTLEEIEYATAGMAKVI